MSSMFSPNVVGQANGQSAGWGNLGGGVAQLVMPQFFNAIVKTGATDFAAWRIAFFIPGLFQTLQHLQLCFLAKTYQMEIFTSYRRLVTCTGTAVQRNCCRHFWVGKYFLQAYRWMGVRFHGEKVWNQGKIVGLVDYQTISGVLCAVLGLLNTLSASIAVMIIFSIFVQAAEGLTFGIVPFVSRRSLGVVSGMTGAGGNVGAVLTQVIFFRGTQFKTEEGITYMGVMIIGCTLGIMTIYFPQWGGMLCGPRKGFTEEDYYLQEWDSKEQDKDLHLSSMKFAEGSRNERSSNTKSVPKEEGSPTAI
ncbi:High-affinity nitrate transporter 2.3 [Bienertia sinuspersici]